MKQNTFLCFFFSAVTVGNYPFPKQSQNQVVVNGRKGIKQFVGIPHKKDVIEEIMD